MAEHSSDAVLLERYAHCREQEAFAALVRRHGPRVLAACRRVLGSEHDAEDVAQATFLVLSLKAGEVPWQGSIGGWLCGVARRLSLNARAGALRRGRHETPAASLAEPTDRASGPIPEDRHPQADPLVEVVRRDLRRVIDDELSHLPEKYREPVVLCDLEGLTHEEAARRLGWPSGSMSRRLGRARALLRRRLAGRGLPAAVLLLLGLLLGLGVWGWDRRHPPELLAVSEAMVPFRPAAEGGQDFERLLARIAGGAGPSATTEEVLRAAEASATVAVRIEDLDPGRDRSAWRSYATRMKLASLRMSDAARSGDAPELLAAARAVNDSCVRCHDHFRQ